jgi:hypothetical protein
MSDTKIQLKSDTLETFVQGQWGIFSRQGLKLKVAQEHLESFPVDCVAQGFPTVGTYRPNKETLEAYAKWCKERK